MSAETRFNPFPGPKPFRASDKDRFFGREELSHRLMERILAWPCVTLYGPSGSGKSSLMQAGVIPRLAQEHRFRTVWVDGWPPGQRPLEWLVQALFSDLELGEVPRDVGLVPALDEAVKRLKRQSSRPLLVYLDQLEQLFFPTRDPEATAELLAGLEELALKPVQGLQLVLALREDYLGRFRHDAQGRQPLLAQGFRLGPMTVGELSAVMCRLAGTGAPPQTWDEAQLGQLLMQVRLPGQAATPGAEVQAAFAQIVCRALWEERDAGTQASQGTIDAEPILHRYLERTLESLGPLKEDGRRLLEEHLIAADGSRTLLTEQQARAALGEAATRILESLEQAAVLRAEEHHGSRYFELGHDWLARKVFELRTERLREQREQAAQQQTRESLKRNLRRVATVIAILVAVVVGGMLVLLVSAKEEATRQSHEAQVQSEAATDANRRARLIAEQARNEAIWAQKVALDERQEVENLLKQRSEELKLLREAVQHETGKYDPVEDLARTFETLWGARELFGHGEPAQAARLLLEVPRPEAAPSWASLAQQVLGSRQPELTVPAGTVRPALDREGARMVGVAEGRIRVWSLDGRRPHRDLPGPADKVSILGFSPDGLWVMAGFKDGSAQLLSSDGTTSRALKAHAGAVTAAAFSPDSLRVVTASEDGLARVSQVDDGRELASQQHDGPVTAVAFSPGAGRRVLTASRDRTARLWGWADEAGKPPPPVVVLPHGGPVLAAAFDPDGERKRVVTASADGIARIWRAEQPGEPVELTGHTGQVVSARFSPDGERIITASDDGTARLWRSEGGDALRVLRGHGGRLTSASFSPDGQRVVTTSEDGSARVWPLEGGGAPAVLEGHKGAVASAIFTGDGRHVLTSSATDQTARLWQVGRWSTAVVVEGQAYAIRSAAFSQDGARVALILADGTVRVGALNRRGALPPLKGIVGRADTVALSPDGARVAVGSGDKKVRVWLRPDKSAPDLELAGHNGLILSAAFSPDGARLVTASADGTARIWSLKEPASPRVLSHAGAVTSAAFSPDGKWVVTTSVDRTARVWRADDGEQQAELGGHLKAVLSATFSPDGKRVATASADGTARVWRRRDDGQFELITSLVGHQKAVASVAFSPDGERVVTASVDRTARVWRADGKAPPTVLEGHTGGVDCAAFSLNGKQVVTGSEDGTARVWAWQADGGATFTALRGHGGPVYEAGFVRDGQRIATASADGTVRLWRTDGVGDAVVFEEREQYVLTAALDLGPGGTPSGANAPVVTAAAITPDGERVLAGLTDGTVRVARRDGTDGSTLRRPSGTLVSLTYDQEGRPAVVTSADGIPFLWRGAQAVPLAGYHGPVRDAALSADGARLVMAAGDGSARVWQTDGTAVAVVTASADGTVRVMKVNGAGEALAPQGPLFPVATAALSPDGKRVALAFGDGRAAVVPVDGQEAAVPLSGHTRVIQSIAFSPDGEQLATTSADGTARVWRVDWAARKAKSIPLEGHAGNVRRAAFSSDGRRVVTASADGTARVWSANGEGDALVLDGGGAAVLAAAFSSDGKWVWTVTADGSTRSWPIVPAELRRLLELANRDCLSVELRRRYLGESVEVARRNFAVCERSSGR